MGKTITKTALPPIRWPVIPLGLRMAIGIGIPFPVAIWVLWHQFSTLPTGAWKMAVQPELLLLVVALMPLNWALETLKWAELMPHGKITTRGREVLFGTAWSLIGPFRIGAAIGRISAVHAKNRRLAMSAFAVASVSQWWCTVFATSLALFAHGLYGASFIAFSFSAMGLALYFNWNPRFWSWIKKTRFVGFWRKARRISTDRRKRTLSLSMARFGVMLTQFVISLNAFGHLGHSTFITRLYDQSQGIAITWGLTSLTPFPLIGDLGIREAAALTVLPSSTPTDVTAIVCATLSLWAINLILPSIAGLIWQWKAMHTQAKRPKLRA